MEGLDLPRPWVEVARNAVVSLNRDDPSPAHLQEIAAGANVTANEIPPEELAPNSNPPIPLSPRARAVYRGRWVELKNEETGQIVRLRFEADDTNPPRYEVNAVVIPYRQGQELTGVDLRNIPLAAITAAYARYDTGTLASLKIGFTLEGQDLPEPLDPLPPASRRDTFSALVGRQYMALERGGEAGNIAKAMAALNGKPVPTVQRWIAQARKGGFLEPAKPRGH
ncbi:hypothetical protein [Gulosibacter sediminis]|uniref:hypothetical protein n=1 Tax=Gulosibacter sediminis TaxID=1729695 RepID=UPI0024A800E2|nr:hypothetical protein [Gulosibacter sediminis]